MRRRSVKGEKAKRHAFDTVSQLNCNTVRFGN